MSMIREIRTYRDENGKTIKMAKSISDKSDPGLFIGAEKVKVVGTDQEVNWEFIFPAEITDIESAFARFDEVLKRRLDERNEKIKANLKTPSNDLP